MSPALVEIIVVLLLIVANGLFAMAEIAIVSARTARLQEMVGRGSRGARLALRLLEKPTEFLATIQIGISLIGIISGAYAGVTIGERLAAVLVTMPLLAPHAEFLGVGVVVITITYLSLVIGELAPKRVALAHREALAARMAPLMYALSLVASPASWVLAVSTNAVLRLLRVEPTGEAPISDQELRTLVSEGTAAGVFEEYEQDLIERLLRLDDRRIGSIMRQRQQVVWLDAEAEPAALLDAIVSSGYSRYPVYRGSHEHIVGVLKARKLTGLAAQQQPVVVDDLLEPPVFIPENVSLLDGLEELKDSGTKLAVVVDEYGSAEGIVTLNDIMQALLGGHIVTGQGEAPGLVKREEGGYLVDGLLPVDEFREHFGVPEEADAPYHTVAGMLIAHLGDMPETGAVFEWSGLRFEVLDMDGRRVDKILVTPLRGPEDARGQ